MTEVIDHPFFNDFADAFASQSVKQFDSQAREHLRQYVCSLFPAEILAYKWPGWELGIPRPSGFIPVKRLEIWRTDARVFLKDFFKRVENGVLYADYSIILERFGEGIDARIGKSAGPHFNLEASYWTFNIKFNRWTGENVRKYGCSLVCGLDEALANFDIVLRTAFFTTPGPHEITAKKMKSMQDKLLKEFAPSLRRVLLADIWG